MPPHPFLRARTPFPLDAGFFFRIGRKGGRSSAIAPLPAQGNASIGLLRRITHAPLPLVAVAWFLLKRNSSFRLEVFYGD